MVYYRSPAELVVTPYKLDTRLARERRLGVTIFRSSDNNYDINNDSNF